MKRFLILVSFLVLGSATQLRANSIDPNIGVRDPISCGDFCTPVGGPNGNTPFTFSSDAAGGGILTFQVDPHGPGFNTLDIETLGVFSPVGCFSNVFVCSVTILDGSVTDMFFSVDAALPAGRVFQIDLNNDQTSTDTTGSGGWTALHSFTAFENLQNAPLHSLIPVPEPPSLVLLAAGMAALLASRKFAGLFGRWV